MDENMVPQLVGTVIFIILIVAILLPLMNFAISFMGDSFCSSSVQLRSIFNNLFAGAWGRAIIPDSIFNIIPLMCKPKIEISEGSGVEELLADKIVECFNKYGKGQLDGVFPHASILCGAVVYDSPIITYEEGGDNADYFTAGVDLMEVYALMVNNSNFNSILDYDNAGLDNSNPFRFCLKPVYAQSIFNEMFVEQDFRGGAPTECFGYTNTGGAIPNPYTESIASYYTQPPYAAVPLTEDGEQLYFYTTSCIPPTVVPDTYGSFDITMHEKNGCFSIREAALNAWKFNMVPHLDEEYFSTNEDLIMFCNDLCIRDCEAVSNSITVFESCETECNTYCANLASNSLYTPPSGDERRYRTIPSFTIGSDEFNFEDDKSFLFSGVVQVQDNTPLVYSLLRRGTFYIRFFDYADWVQQLSDSTWHSFPECENNIIYLGGTIQQGNVFWDTSNNHDFVAVCYVPYVPYELLHAEELGTTIDQSVVVVS